MTPEWTVEIKEDPCRACGGSGKKPDVQTAEGNTRTFTSGGLCPECGGHGKIIQKVGLAELRAMLEQA
jgi:DnaJ-class molecular chaperone